jgi:hypothetical protein
MSGCCTKWSPALEELRLVAQTWTAPVDSPPVTVKVIVCPTALSMMVL